MLDHNVPQPWQGQTTLVFALAAVAVGLGNVFRLPFLMGEYGGAPFFLAYAVTVVLVATPLLASEVMLGSSGRGSPVGALRWAADQAGRDARWSWLGGLQALVALLIAAKLLTLAVWAFDRAQVINAGALASASGREVADSFITLLADTSRVGWLTLWFVVPAAVLVALGPAYAMGLIGWVGLPGMVVAGLALVGYGLEYGDLQLADEYLFARDYGNAGLGAVLAGMESGIYTLGAGLGVGLCFGARAPTNMPLLRSVAAAMVLDIAFVVAIAIAIVPLLFATNVAPSEGLSLVFVGVPYAYANLPMGDVYGALFFGFLSGTLLFTVVALMEPGVMLMRQEWAWHRVKAAAVVALGVGALAWLMQSSALGWTHTVLGSIDVIIPASLLLMALFVGWRLPRPIVRGELFREPRWLFLLWWQLVRFVVPTVLGVVLFLRAWPQG